MSYPTKTGAYLQAVHPDKPLSRARDEGNGIELVWPEQYGPKPTEAEVEAWDPAGSVTDVDKFKEVFIAARRNATLLVDTIKAMVQDALVKSKTYSQAEATVQGVEFVFHHSVSIAAYKEAGGHPAAAAKLLSVFKSEPSVNAFPWVPGVAAIFDQALTY